mgnify:CR=1 FL=1
MIVGTAGHIDHGKTSLVRALTGIDTDRLKEEKERGITIELGFAHLALPRSGVVGVVDVPGHERFVRTMVAGAVGIDLVVLVVRDDAYGMIRWKQAEQGLTDFGMTFKNPDFVRLAEAYGARGHRPQSTADFAATLDTCLQAGGVHVIDLLIDYASADALTKK